MMAELLQNVCNKYKKSVSCNPDLVGQIESLFRVSSYIIAGRYNDSQVLSELVYSASRLMILTNDMVLQQAVRIVPKVPLSQDRLMRLLTVLEYIEVFVELAVQRLWGEVGRWVVVTVIQLANHLACCPLTPIEEDADEAYANIMVHMAEIAVLRFLLLIWYQAGIQPTPPIAPLDREVLRRSGKQTDLLVEDLMPENSKPKETFVLKRSGKVMRTLSAAPRSFCRTWTLPEQDDVEKKLEYYQPSELCRLRMFGEGIHIARPLVHILYLSLKGQKSWKPWLLSCVMDVTSLCLMGDPVELNPNERTELRRRTFTLLYYLLRSPFYDRFSQAKIIFLLRVLSDQVPGIGHFLRPLIEYLPYWQKVYFYLWST